MTEKTTVYYLDTLPYSHQSRAVALGFFDGIHTGHEAIIRKCVKTAALNGIKSTVMTFINFDRDQRGCLTTIEERREILSSFGVDELLVLDFSEISDMESEDFLSTIIRMKLSSGFVFAGSDYRFGAKAKGDVSALRKFCEENAIECEIFDDMNFGDTGRRISSTWLKEALEEGDAGLYASLCSGRPFSYSGMVVPGNKLGRTMGFPTANIEIAGDKFKARFGVYVSRIKIGKSVFYGMSNIGLRPTVGDLTTAICESNIFDFDDDIYGARITVELLDFIRPEKKFDSLEELTGEIEANKVQAKTYLINSGIICP